LAKLVALAAAVVALAYFGATFKPVRVPLVAVAVILSVAAMVLGIRFRPEKEVEYHDSFSG
jgi:hypothetical protein